jgi:DNA-binding YbaB/EbfC family protein
VTIVAKGGFQGGGFGGGGMNMNMLKQAQKMQADMMKMQAEMEEKTYTATSGGGVVTAVANGKHELVSLKIDPEAVDPEDVEMLCDMVTAAVNEAMRLADAAMSSSMSKLTGGLNLGF